VIRSPGIFSYFILLFFTAVLAESALAACPVINASTTIARGIVFQDLNRNGQAESGEPGVAKVSVSNGCGVVQTSTDGHYEIPLSPRQILFISQPSGYAVPVDENMLPQFFYRHYPDGTPSEIDGTSVQWLWSVIETTGPLPEKIDFPLYQLEESEMRFKAHGLADPQARTDLGEDMLREDLVNTLLDNPYDAKFVLTVGDVVYDNLALYDRHKKMIGLIGIPQWNLPGNHDINYESPNAYFANETFKKHFGPIYYSFQYGNVHIVALNNVEYAGAANGGYRGAISTDQLDWLQQDLANVAKDKLIVIATHIPLLSEATDTRGNSSQGPGTENLAELLKILEPFENIYGLAGHDTSNSWKVEINHDHGWTGKPWIAHTLAEVRGSGWDSGPADLRGVRNAMMHDGNPNGFYLLNFEDTKLTPQFIPFPNGESANKAMRIVLDPPLTVTDQESINRGKLKPNSKIVVNLFDGGARDSVSISLNGAEGQAMTYAVRTDPFMELQYQKYQSSDNPMPEPTLSAHVWEYELPGQLYPGIHSVIVRSEDEFGQRHQGHFTFEVAP